MCETHFMTIYLIVAEIFLSKPSANRMVASLRNQCLGTFPVNSFTVTIFCQKVVFFNPNETLSGQIPWLSVFQSQYLVVCVYTSACWVLMISHDVWFEKVPGQTISGVPQTRTLEKSLESTVSLSDGSSRNVAQILSSSCQHPETHDYINLTRQLAIPSLYRKKFLVKNIT